MDKWVFAEAASKGVSTDLVDEAANFLASGRFPYFRGVLYRHRFRVAKELGRPLPAPRAPTIRFNAPPPNLGSRFD